MNRTTQPASPSAVDLSAPDDPRARAFCSPEGPEVFYAVAHSNEIWRPDPFDVETIHDEAREVFRRLVARASMTPRPTSGRILLLKGESGSGKTHLMRAFRNWAHERASRLLRLHADDLGGRRLRPVRPEQPDRLARPDPTTTRTARRPG